MEDKALLQVSISDQLKQRLKRLLKGLRRVRAQSGGMLKGRVEYSAVVSAALEEVVHDIDAVLDQATREASCGPVFFTADLVRRWLRAGCLERLALRLVLRGSLAAVGARARMKTNEYPWRSADDLYHLYVAEALLRRTTRRAVKDVYLKITTRYPSAKHLADADIQELQRLLSPIGMTSRAALLIDGARRLAEEEQSLREQAHARGDQLICDLRKIPLVGQYTADALALHAFSRPVLPLDGNAVRVLWRSLQGRNPPSSARRKPYEDPWLLEARDSLTAHAAPTTAKLVHYGLLEVAWENCRPRNPRCNTCPIAPICKYPKARARDGDDDEQALQGG